MLISLSVNLLYKFNEIGVNDEDGSFSKTDNLPNKVRDITKLPKIFLNGVGLIRVFVRLKSLLL